MKSIYQKAKSEIQILNEIDTELPWLLTLDLVVVVIALGFSIGVAL